MLRLLAGEAARRFGARAAVVSGATCLTYAQLDRLSDEVAAGLAHRGIRIGDVVALILPDGPEFVVCYLAAAKIGAITAGIGTDRPQLLAKLDPAIVVTVPGVLPPLAGVDVVVLHPGDDLRMGGLRRAEPPPPPFPPDPDRHVVITFTSGTTGPPKGVLFGDRQLEAIRAHGAGARWGVGDARLVTHPFWHMAFATRLPVFLQTGRTSHILPRWDAEAAVRMMRERELRVLQGTPRQLAEILKTGAALPALTLALSSGAPAPPELVRALREKYGVPVCNRYICTEAGLGLGTRPEDPPEDAEQTVGRPRAGVDVSIRDTGGRILEAEEEGEVLLRSRAVMSGYIEKSLDRWVFARDGFVRTGDRGYIDSSGRLHLVGRVAKEGP
ncbi:class I adenylate-forming enzyme family protein [Thermoactinospora rubra]|uniref:class I adenylate-forming enzyme family protein n=1 Tax=Thermoactinospora rubra TaxID=1088767 RepID=UPI000A0F913E|nr:class I adenylate-forming enzyme family protein [Thermoactinospora rubra]